METTSKKKAVVIFSGGMDSATLLCKLKDEGFDVLALGFNYGQRHVRELEHAKKFAELEGIPYHVVDLSELKFLLKGSSQTDASVPVPHGHYADENMKLTVVPNRNMIMLSIAAGYAISEKAKWIAYAAHAGDHTIYPDCRPVFVDTLNAALGLADWHSVQIMRPFIELTKGEIVMLGDKLDVSYIDTYSCYEGEEVHCGLCGTCTERKEAFAQANVTDPTTYKAP